MAFVLFVNFLIISDAQPEKKVPTFSAVNKTCDDTNQEVVDNLEDCKDALSFVTSIKPMNNGGYPRGCFLLINYGWFWNREDYYFNTHKLGNREASSRQLCKPSKIDNIKTSSFCHYFSSYLIS